MSAPDKPVISITVLSASSVRISWSAITGAISYNIERKTLTGTYAIVGTTASTTYTDIELLPDTDYVYRVNVFDKCGNTYSDPKTTLTDCSPPSIPFGLTAVTNDTSIALTWITTFAVTQFIVEKKVHGVGSYAQIASTVDPNYTDYSVSPSTCYDYRVRAVNCDIVGDPSDVVLACTSCDLPSDVPFLVSSVISDKTISLEWGEPSNADTFTLERWDALSGWAVVTSLDATILTYTDDSLTGDIEYCYRIRGVNSCGNGNYSPIACGRTLIAPTCHTGSQTFNWTVDRTSEPGFWAQKPNPSVYLRHSNNGAIDISDSRISRIQFDNTSDLDDILILVHENESVTQDYLNTSSSSSGGRSDVKFTIPYNSIIFANTIGYYINGDGYDHGFLVYSHTTEKQFVESNTTHNVTIPAGKPPGTPENTGLGNYLDFQNAGFTVANFSNGIDKQTLIDKGFVDSNGIFRFRFAHVLSGLGHVYLNNMTCDVLGGSSTSSSDCTVSDPTTLTAVGFNGGVNLDWAYSGNTPISFAIQRSTSLSGGWIDYDQVPGTQTTYTDVQSADLEYCYRVRALSCNGNTSGFTDAACATQTGCPSICDVCCCDYEFVITGTSTTLDGTYHYHRDSSSCVWTDRNNANVLHKVTVDGVDYWELVISTASDITVWQAFCQICPPDDSSVWTLTTYTTADIPSMTMGVLNCTGLACGSSSSSSGVCSFRANAIGGVAGYDGNIDLSAVFGTSSSSSHIFAFTYQTYQVPDRLILSTKGGLTGGKTVFDSGCVGTRDPITIPIKLMLDDNPLKVRVFGDCVGFGTTEWSWNLNCLASSSSSGYNADCSGCCSTYVITVTGSPALNGTYTLLNNCYCTWSGNGTQAQTEAAIYYDGGEWTLQLWCSSCSVYFTAPTCSTACTMCPPISGQSGISGFSGMSGFPGSIWTYSATEGGVCPQPSISVNSQNCPSGVMAVTLEWADNGGPMTFAVNFNNIKVGNGMIAPYPEYTAFTGIDYRKGGSEAVYIYLDRARAGSLWDQSISMSVMADQSSSLPAGSCGSYVLSVTWKGVTQSFCGVVTNVNSSSAITQIANIVANLNGTFTLDTSMATVLPCGNACSSSSSGANPCATTCTSCCHVYTVVITGGTCYDGSYILTPQDICIWALDDSWTLLCNGASWQITHVDTTGLCGTGGSGNCIYKWTAPIAACPPIVGWSFISEDCTPTGPTPTISVSKSLC